MNRFKWIENDFLVLKLEENCYTVARMLDHPVMQFLDIVRDRDDWEGVELAELKSVFRVYVGGVVLKRLAVRTIKKQIPSDFLGGGLWIKPHVNFGGGFPFLGGKLVDCGRVKGLSPLHAPVLKETLTLPENKELIESCELTNMWGDEDLGDRLRRYFHTGVNRDDLKFEVFPRLWIDREVLRPLTRRLPLPLR